MLLFYFIVQIIQLKPRLVSKLQDLKKHTDNKLHGAMFIQVC